MTMKKWIACMSAAAMAACVFMPAALAEEDGDLKPIEIELPKPNFGGTPLDYWGENLEPPSFKDRPPFMAPAGTTNVALEKEVTSSEKPLINPLSNIVDGDKEYFEKNVVELPAGDQWVQIDLGEMHEIYAVLLWHFHAAERVYFDVAIKVAEDAEFTKGVETIFNNDHDNSAGRGVGEDKEYIENYKGRLFDAEGVRGQFVRLYSNKNTSDDKNHYVEVEVYGKPVK
jgi:hypothetical protein